MGTQFPEQRAKALVECVGSKKLGPSGVHLTLGSFGWLSDSHDAYSKWCSSTFLFCHGQNLDYTPRLGDGHPSAYRDLINNYQESHYGMDDHEPYTMLWSQHMLLKPCWNHQFLWQKPSKTTIFLWPNTQLPGESAAPSCSAGGEAGNQLRGAWLAAGMPRILTNGWLLFWKNGGFLPWFLIIWHLCEDTVWWWSFTFSVWPLMFCATIIAWFEQLF